VGLALSELYLCAVDRLAAELIDEFIRMAAWWAEKIRTDEAAAGGPVKLGSLRGRHYKEWVKE